MTYDKEVLELRERVANMSKEEQEAGVKFVANMLVKFNGMSNEAAENLAREVAGLPLRKELMH